MGELGMLKQALPLIGFLSGHSVCCPRKCNALHATVLVFLCDLLPMPLKLLSNIRSVVSCRCQMSLLWAVQALIFIPMMPMGESHGWATMPAIVWERIQAIPSLSVSVHSTTLVEEGVGATLISICHFTIP